MSEQIPQPTIAELNDRFRQMTPQMVLTPGVQILPDVPGLIGTVQQFNDFTEDNDPYGEHDFGAITWHGEKTYWKIDYYDQNLEYGEDPLSPECRRVLTVMISNEY